MNRLPVRLKFKETKPAAPFLKLDPDGKSDLAGWDDFFGGPQPQRGFYSCFPVESLKKGAVALATFEAAGQKEQPWLATHAAGKGKAVWIGSPEVYRLRAFSETFHERFWLELARHAAPARAR